MTAQSQHTSGSNEAIERKKELGAIFVGLSEYYEKPLSKAQLQIYLQALDPYGVKDIRAAVDAHVRDRKSGSFFPKINDILRHISLSDDSKAERAWSKVHDAVRLIGPNYTLVFDDPIIHATLRDMGGFIKLCTEKSDTMPFRKQEFMRIYASYCGHGAVIPIAPMSSRGELEDDSIVYVGDMERAKHVHQLAAKATPQADRLNRVLGGVTKALTGGRNGKSATRNV